MTKEGQATAVQVALRIRPLTDRDRAQPRFAKLANDDVLKLQDKTVQVVSQNKHFSFDHVFGTTSTQEDVFSAVGDNLIRKFIEGYNITILAYGQTSSGKTHTMGTASVKNSIDEGIVPRSMTLLFDLLQQDSTRPDSPALSVSSSSSTSRRKSSRASKTPSFLSQPYSSSRPGHKNTVTVSFIEIYNEDLHDLLSSAPPEESPPITIREDTKGNIYWTGVKEVQVQSAEDVLYFLEQGTQNRATGATDMNEKSSRSHAIFSVTLRQEKATANEPKKSTSTSRPGSRPASSLSNRTRASHTPKATSDESEKTITVSKFHFVDLAGSERLKRTAAQGDRRKEGININAGLLALGNVISALASDSARKKLHVPYRDSKLTRLLQDSLGGNATTVMIACVSPAEYNLAETLNTLQYANRARSIKNRSEKNEVEEWMTTDNLELLRSIVGKLKHELKYVKSSGSKPEEDEASDDDHSLEQRLLIADLQRQVEELDGEASVTRERNRMVERELHRLRLSPPEKKEDDFQHLVEPVIEEYEKSISNLESQLALTKAALNYSDVGFEEQQSKIHRLESLGKSHEHSLETLQAQLAKVTERDQNNESYILELENKLMVSAKDASRDQCMLSDLKSRIAKLKETDQNTEQYIHDLEQRLAAAESQDKQHKALIEELESKVDARERTHLELLKKLAHQPSPLPSPQENEAWRAQLASLEKERDALKHQVDLLSVVKPAQIPDEPSRSPPAITQRATRPKQTLADERDSAEALIQANAQLAQASERADRLQHTLDRLQVDHQTTLKELDEALQRYHETVEQLDFMDHSRASSTTHEEESTVLDLSKEMAMAKEEEEKQAYLGQISQLQAQLGRQEKEQHAVIERLQHELGNAQRQLTIQAEQRAVALSQTQQTVESLERQLSDTQATLQMAQACAENERQEKIQALTDAWSEEKKTLLQHSTQAKERQQETHAQKIAEMAAHASLLQEKLDRVEKEEGESRLALQDALTVLRQEKQHQEAEQREHSQQVHASLTEQAEVLASRLLAAQEESGRHLASLEAARQEMGLQQRLMEGEKDQFRTETADLRLQLEQKQKKLEQQQAEEEEIQAAMDEECEGLRGQLRQAQEALAAKSQELASVKRGTKELEEKKREEISQPQASVAQHSSEEAQSLHKGAHKKTEEKPARLNKLQSEISLPEQVQETDGQRQQRHLLEKETKAREEAEKALEKVRFELAKTKRGHSIHFVYEDRIQQLEKQLAQKSDENAEYTSLSEELEKEIGRLTQEQAGLAQALALAREGHTKYQTLIESIKQSFQLSSADDALTDDLQRLLPKQTQDPPADLSSATEHSRASVHRLKRENQRLNEQQAAHEQSIESLQKEQHATMARLQTTLQAQTNTVRDELQKKLKAAEHSLDEEKVRAEKAERMNLVLEKRLEALQKSKKSFMCF